MLACLHGCRGLEGADIDVDQTAFAFGFDGGRHGVRGCARVGGARATSCDIMMLASSVIFLTPFANLNWVRDFPRRWLRKLF